MGYIYREMLLDKMRVLYRPYATQKGTSYRRLIIAREMYASSDYSCIMFAIQSLCISTSRISGFDQTSTRMKYRHDEL